MPDFLQLTLFPPGALQSSVITTVWVGVCIVVFLNARFGTTVAGLVVPGYLVPLFFVKPISAMVVLFEAYVTYGLAYLLANKLMVKSGYSEMFGRDRFFALILLSVLVRIVLDFYLLPLGVSHFGEYLGDYDLKNNLQSFGLIIVALIANQMWMGGVAKGTKALFLYLTLTFAVIYWVLIPLTNFNIGGLSYMYEDLATSLLSSPKAYIILLTTAFIASRMNLQFGWEFNGILIPALLALQWYQPEKLLFTFVEAAIILVLGTMVMRIPFLRGVTFEGGRLLLLFFNVGFVYKILLGFALIEFLPTEKISDYYGFGYVVSTLIAVKVYQKRIAVKMAVSTLFTSLAGIAIATVIGFILTFMGDATKQEETFSNRQAIQFSDKNVFELYNQIRPQSLFSERNPAPLDINYREDVEAFLTRFQALKNQPANTLLGELNLQFSDINMDAWYTKDNLLILHKVGVGFYVLRVSPQSPLVIEIPRARAELGAATLGLAMFEKVQASALFIDLSYQLQRSGEYIFDSMIEQGLFHTFHQVFSEHNILQLRGDLKVTEARKRLKDRSELTQGMVTILREVPNGFPVDLLRNIVPELTYNWQEHVHNLQWQHDSFGIAELKLNNKEMRSALSRIEVYKSTDSQDSIENLEGYLVEWLLERKQAIARKGSEAFIIPSQNELLFWHQDILVPLMTWLKEYEQSGWTTQSRNELQRLNLQADSVGYEFRILTRPLSGQQFLILQERIKLEDSDVPLKHWATLVMNLQAKNNDVIKVPNPFFEKTSFEFGSVLFKQMQNRFLLLSGSHPWANPDGSSNVTLAGNTQTLYHIMYMAIAKEFDKQNVLPIQVRGFSYQESRPFPAEHVLVSLWQNINQHQPSDSINNLLSVIQRIGLNYRFVDGDFITAPYYLSTNQQIDYLNYLSLSDFVTLWVSPLARDSFKATDAIKVEEQHARLLKIPVYRQDIQSFRLNTQPTTGLVSEKLQAQLLNYAQTRNIHSLKRAYSLPEPLTLAYLLDSSSFQQFILVLDDTSSIVAVVNLNSLNSFEIFSDTPQALSTFVESRHRWLLPRYMEAKP